MIREADALGLGNFSVICNHVLTLPAIGDPRCTPEAAKLRACPSTASVGLAHVSTVIGSRPYAAFAQKYRNRSSSPA